MVNIQAKNKNWRIRLLLKVIIIVLIISIGFMIRGLWGVYKKSRLAEESKIKSAEELTELEMQKKDLEDKVSWLNSERGQEEEIRRNFSVAREGEKVFIVVEKEEEKKASTTIKKQESVWQNLINNVKDIWPF